ncbi:MAG: hypothetical protein PHW69_04680 [Elusimicrobiaceae bacterium]|nr:hypothetical protein [Elusimicrobiaceae bacterium]
MKKIRRFKIPVHHKEIARRIGKAQLALPAAGLADTGALYEFIFGLASELQAGVVYNSFDKSYAALDLTGLPPARMFSAAAVTLGENPYRKIASYAEIPLREAGALAVYEFLETAFDFVADLIKSEAEAENFEPGTPEILFSPQMTEHYEMKVPDLRFNRKGSAVDCATAAKALPEILKELNAGKIDVTLDADGQITNKLSAVFLMPWEPRRKAKTR